MTREIKEVAKEAFELNDWLMGTKTGGVEAPRIMISCEDRGDSVVIAWRHPETCGLSDCRYHYSDLSVQEDVFSIDAEHNMLLLNGNNDVFCLDGWPELAESISDFLLKWELNYPPIKDHIRLLAEEVDRFYHGYDTYGYWDAVDDTEANIARIEAELRTAAEAQIASDSEKELQNIAEEAELNENLESAESAKFLAWKLNLARIKMPDPEDSSDPTELPFS